MMRRPGIEPESLRRRETTRETASQTAQTIAVFDPGYESGKRVVHHLTCSYLKPCRNK